MRSQDEIDTEAKKLEEMKPTVRRCSSFGDNHHDAIDAQVRVLRERMSEDDIYSEFGDEGMDDFAQNVLDEALEARWWMCGDNDTAPSEAWKDLV